MIDETTKKILFKSTWTPQKLRDTRERFNLTQNDIADLLGVTKSTVSQLELGNTMSGPLFMSYCFVMERYYAYLNGYMPAYRKIGETDFVEIRA